MSADENKPITRGEMANALRRVQLYSKVYASAECASMISAQRFYENTLLHAVEDLNFEAASDEFDLVVKAITAHVVECLFEALRLENC